METYLHSVPVHCNRSCTAMMHICTCLCSVNIIIVFNEFHYNEHVHVHADPRVYWLCTSATLSSVNGPWCYQPLVGLTLIKLDAHTQPFYGPFLGQSGWAGARRELLDFMVQGEINRGRHTDHPAGRHPIQTNQCPPSPSPHVFLQAGCLSAAQPTMSKHWRQQAHSD